MNISNSMVAATICFLLLIATWTPSLNHNGDIRRKLFDRCLLTFVWVFGFMGILGGNLFKVVRRLDSGSEFFSPPIIASLLIGILLSLVQGFLSHKYELGKSHTIGFTVLSLMAAPILVSGCIYYLNEVFDRSRPISHRVTLLEKIASRSKSGMKYKFQVTDWQYAHSEVDFSVSRATYANHNEYEKITIVIRKGFFGTEWVQSVG